MAVLSESDERLLGLWLGRFSPGCRAGLRSVVLCFLRWVRGRGEFGSLGEMLEFQKGAVGDDRYRIVDLLISHVQDKGGTYKGMVDRYGMVRSFFLHHRAELPRVPVRFRPTRDQTVGRLDLNVLRMLVRCSGLRGQAIYLTLFQGLMDQTRFMEFNTRGFELAEHIRQRGIATPFRVEFLRGRKGNVKPFNTWIGRDALEAWRSYFERERGWPQPGEPAALDQRGKAMTKHSLCVAHWRLLRKLKFIDRWAKPGERFGLGLHELRDLARSILEKARADGFNPLSAEYWMGHTVDPLYYNKVWKLDPDYNLAQYRIAEKYLNITSNVGFEPTPTSVDEVIDQIIANKPAFEKLLQALAEKMNSKIAPL